MKGDKSISDGPLNYPALSLFSDKNLLKLDEAQNWYEYLMQSDRSYSLIDAARIAFLHMGDEEKYRVALERGWEVGMKEPVTSSSWSIADFGGELNDDAKIVSALKRHIAESDHYRRFNNAGMTLRNWSSRLGRKIEMPIDLLQFYQDVSCAWSQRDPTQGARDMDWAENVATEIKYDEKMYGLLTELEKDFPFDNFWGKHILLGRFTDALHQLREVKKIP